MLNELLGFVVLTSPLWLILILLLVCGLIAYVIAKRFKARSARVVVGLISFLLVFMVPFGDEIVGRVYLSYLCDNKADRIIYQTTALPSEYWDDQGKPKFIDYLGGALDSTYLGNRFKWRRVSEPKISGIVKITKINWILYDTKTQIKLAAKVTYSRHAGWIASLSPAPYKNQSCHNLMSKRYGRKTYADKRKAEEIDFLQKIFIR